MNLKLARKLSGIVGGISPKLLFQLSYFHNRGTFPNLKHPKNLSEIIGAQMLSGEINNYSEYVDKIGMRKYIIDWLGEDHLPRLFGVWDSFDAIDFSLLPASFVLKTNHGCNCNIVCFDKESFDKNAAKKMIEKSLSSSYGGALETQYRSIKPRVFAEELLSEDGKSLPMDYKFHCFNGQINGILMCASRGEDGEALKRLYSPDWENVDVMKAHKAPFDFEKPKEFDEMKELVCIIASKFKQVRVDMYDVNGHIYVGELTFTPQGGILRNFTMEGLYYLAK